MKFKNMKRFGSVVMAGAMALSLVVPAFAEAAESVNTSTEVTGGYVTIPISVLVPTSGSAQINPYGLPVVVGAKADGTNIEVVGEQISNVPMYVTNYGTTDLDMDASLAVVPKGGVIIKDDYDVTNPGADTGKQMKVTLQVAAQNDHAFAKGVEDESLIVALYEKYAADGTWNAATELVAPDAASPTATVTPTKSTDTGNTTPMATLGAATVNGEAITYGDDSIALFRLKGEMNAEPVKSVSGGGTEEDPWVEADGFTATIVFKFKPHTTAGGGGGTTPAGDVTINVTGGAALDSSTTTTCTLTAAISGTNAGGVTIASTAWSGSDDSVATVNATTGVVTYVGAGSVTITATVTGSDGATYTGTTTITCS